MSQIEDTISTVPQIFSGFSRTPKYFLEPVRLFKTYDRQFLKPDLIAGATIAAIVVPQSIAAALIAELPPTTGLYTAIVAALIGALWGSCNQIHTGPNNPLSLLVFSVLLGVAVPGTPEYVLAASVIAIMVGLIQLFTGAARLGMLVNFVSHSVIVGFTAGAGILIAIGQLKYVVGLNFSGNTFLDVIQGLSVQWMNIHLLTLAMGLGTIGLIILLRKIKPTWPAMPLALTAATALTFGLQLSRAGVVVIGELPRGLPPMTPLFTNLSFDYMLDLFTGALAISAIGLVSTTAIGKSISTQTGQRVSSNQEFVGQGLANIAAGIFSGYPGAASFSRSAANFRVGAKTRMSGLFSSLFVLVALFALAPAIAYLPRAAVAGVLIVAAAGMIDSREIVRIWRGARNDALIMVVTLLGTILLRIEFAVLAGIFLSFVVYIFKTSVPRVVPVQPDLKFQHFTRQPGKRPCPQLAILDVYGDLYFGAVSHVEDAIYQYREDHPDQRFLLLRMHSINQCDFSGIHALEGVVNAYREKGGDVFMVRVQEPVYDLMKATGFITFLGLDHFLSEDEAISHIFYHHLDPAICIYECEIKVFQECQNLPKQIYPLDVMHHLHRDRAEVPVVSPDTLWNLIRSDDPPLLIDVREPREYDRGHIPGARLISLRKLLVSTPDLPNKAKVVLVCNTGRRSLRAAYVLRNYGWKDIHILRGGMNNWQTASLLEAIDTQAEEDFRYTF